MKSKKEKVEITVKTFSEAYNRVEPVVRGALDELMQMEASLQGSPFDAYWRQQYFEKAKKDILCSFWAEGVIEREDIFWP